MTRTRQFEFSANMGKKRVARHKDKMLLSAAILLSVLVSKLHTVEAIFLKQSLCYFRNLNFAVNSQDIVAICKVEVPSTRW
ncbi:MAG: hypothetical protein ACK4E0_17965 [Chitinophagaceae bacterium]